MFIGREKELEVLENAYNDKKFSMVVIYGRRRIGKSFLISEFIKNKECIFYTATKVGAARNLDLFSKQAMSLLEPELTKVSFDSLETVLDIIGKRKSNKKLVIVIDELPYWAESDESLLSIIQKKIDTDWINKNIMLILCGSALSFMEKKVLNEKSPLFGRRTAQIKLNTFDYLDSAKFVPKYSSEEKAICYGLTGGVAKYLSLFDDSVSLDENIVRLFFETSGYLYDEPRNYLTQEFSDITTVNNIIENIANGENTIHLIADKTKEKDTTVLYTLEKLIEVGIVEKKKCITEEKNKKKTQYILQDTMFKFWYEFLPKATSVIEMGQGRKYYANIVKPRLHSYMGEVFERMCRVHVLKQGIEGKYNNFITEVGNWWGSELIVDETGKHAQSTDIDIVGVSNLDKTLVVGECKFKNEKIEKDVYEALIRRSKLINDKYKVSKYVFYSLSGYSKWFDDIHEDNIILNTIDDLYI